MSRMPYLRQIASTQPGRPGGIAIPPDEPCFLAVPPGNVTDQHRSWQETPLIEHRHHLVAAQAFAPGHTRQIGEHELKRSHARIGLWKAPRFVRFRDRARLAGHSHFPGAGRAKPNVVVEH